MVRGVTKWHYTTWGDVTIAADLRFKEQLGFHNDALVHYDGVIAGDLSFH